MKTSGGTSDQRLTSMLRNLSRRGISRSGSMRPITASASEDSQARLVSDLRCELRATLDTLIELEDDLDAGHVSARDYEFESTTLRARAALLIRKLEELGVFVPGAA